MSADFLFNDNKFNRLFPFYILLNKELQVTACGKSLQKLYKPDKRKPFNQLFSVPRPFTVINNFTDLLTLHNQLVLLEPLAKNMPQLRGQFEYMEDSGVLLFIGSPWFRSMEEVIDNHLIIDDFAKHDPQIDLLHVMKTQEITNDDLKQLVSTINLQKNELKRANKEVHDIALFPMQNPDPLIRINFEGDVLQNNPAASRLDLFEFENETIRNDIFFKKIADRIDKSSKRWSIEARSGDTEFSFLCILMPEEGYINIYGRDITQKKADELQLERLSQVASANENGVVFTTDKGVIFWCNEGVEKITGYEKSEIIGKTPVELLKGPLTDRVVLKSMSDEVASHKSFSNELIQYRKDGTWFWGRTKGQPVRNSDGNTSYFAIIEDITADKKNEEQLRILSSIAEENTNGVVIADEEGRVEWVNRSFEKITGYPLAEMIGKKPGHMLQGLETDQDTIAYIRKQIQIGEPFVCEILNYHKNGSTYWLRLQGQALKNKLGKIVKFFAIEEDISQEKKIEQQLKEFEAKFKLALEKIGDNVWEHDFRTGVTRFSKDKNNFLTHLEGAEISQEELWRQSIHKFDLPIVHTNDKRYKNGEIDHHIIEYRLLQPDGRVKWVLDRGVVLEKDIHNKPLLIIGTHTDITNQKNIEKELTLAKNAAVLSKKAKEIFLANMSHEIRTPLNAITGMGNQLRKSKLTEKQKFQLDTIYAAAENLLIIINDILDLSKIEAGKLTIEKIGFEPKKVIAKAMQVLMHKAEEKGLSITNSFCDTKLSEVFIGDPHRLNQVLLNLLSNAIKFTEHGSVDIRCTVVEETPVTQTVEVEVQDTGIGMDEEFISKLFEKFSQEYESVTRKYGGTGLGMSICKELIDLMGGNIEVISEKGVGTTIRFRIPFPKGTLKEIPGQNEEKISNDFLSGKTVLVADDNEMNRLVAATILESYGAVIAEAANGEEAFHALRNKRGIDLVLMDIQMPVLNGYDATKKIREAGYTIPVIALTANAVRGENEKCITAGMNDYIAKPFKEDIFLNKIAHWIRKEKAGTTNAQNRKKAKNETKEDALYDLSGLKSISQGNNIFVEKMVSLFCKQSPELIMEMKVAFETNQLEKMGALAHKIKPSIDNLKILSLKQIIREIEKAGKEQQVTVELSGQIGYTEKIIASVTEKLKQEFP